MAAPNVKFPRDITRGCAGKDVIAHKRAISRAVPQRYPWHEFTPYAGDKFIRAVMEFKRSKNMNSLPRLGRTCHEVLERTHKKDSKQWAFDAVAIQDAHDYWELVQTKPEEKVRQAMVSAAFFWYAHRGSIAYSQARPFQVGKPVWVPSRWDCSAFYTCCSYAGGAPDPNGRDFDHQGYTGTLIDHGVRVPDVSHLEPGDAIFYGFTRYEQPGFPKGSPTHVAFYVGVKDGEHRILSHGHYPMGYYTYDYRSDINQYRHYDVAH